MRIIRQMQTMQIQKPYLCRYCNCEDVNDVTVDILMVFERSNMYINEYVYVQI